MNLNLWWLWLCKTHALLTHGTAAKYICSQSHDMYHTSNHFNFLSSHVFTTLLFLRHAMRQHLGVSACLLVHPPLWLVFRKRRLRTSFIKGGNEPCDSLYGRGGGKTSHYFPIGVRAKFPNHFSIRGGSLMEKLLTSQTRAGHLIWMASPNSLG